MTCKHPHKLSLDGLVEGHAHAPQNEEEPAWCPHCGALWSKPSWLGMGKKCRWIHHTNDQAASTLGNLPPETLSREGPSIPLTRLKSLKERLQDKEANKNTKAAVDEIVRDLSPEDRERLMKSALQTMKEQGITVDEAKLQELEKRLAQEEKLAEKGMRTGTVADIAYRLAKTGNSLLNNDRVRGLVLLVVAEEGSFEGDGPLGVVFVRKGFPEAAQELSESLEKTPADLALAEKIARGEADH